MNILVAEDVAVTRRLLEETIRDMGHDVTTVADGLAAWEAYERARPNLVVLDWLMPGLDGLELCRRIRGIDPCGECFVLLQTGRGTSDDLSVALLAGVDDYITKPVTSDHLRARIAIAEARIKHRREHRRAEDALAHAQWLAGIGETALAMQHEVNTPLATLLGVIDLALAASSPAEQRRALHDASEQVRRIADVVHRLGALREPHSIEALPGVRMLDLTSRGSAP